jgi:hypothetical protein
MIDTVKFLKECLEHHARLVDIVLGRPEPLIQQGTDLMQAMLSEMFGLPAPIMQDISEAPMGEVAEGSMVRPEEELESEQESESELTEFSEEDIAPQDFMDIEAVENPETDSDAYDDDDGSSEQSDDSMATVRKSKRISKKEKRKKANKAKEALYTKFGLIVEETAKDQDETQDVTHEEERSMTKRQKRNHDQPPVLRQATLSFDKVRKNRRLFSRKELQAAGQEQEEAEEPDVVSRSLIRRASGKSFRVPPGYRYSTEKEILSEEGRLFRRSDGQ